VKRGEGKSSGEHRGTHIKFQRPTQKALGERCNQPGGQKSKSRTCASLPNLRARGTWGISGPENFNRGGGPLDISCEKTYTSLSGWEAGGGMCGGGRGSENAD